MFNILIVEDDKNTRKLLSAILTNNNFNPISVINGYAALEIIEKEHIDLIITDIMMPEMDGIELISKVRESYPNMPVIILSAKHSKEDKNTGFIVGTDDYLTKPFDHDELILRIKALLRRSKIISEHKITIGDVTLNYDTFTITKNNTNIVLPKKEFLILYKLLSFPNKIFTKNELMNEFWGLDTGSTDHTINVHINRLRSKIELFPEFEIINVRGLGYKAVKKI